MSKKKKKINSWFVKCLVCDQWFRTNRFWKGFRGYCITCKPGAYKSSPVTHKSTGSSKEFIPIKDYDRHTQRRDHTKTNYQAVRRIEHAKPAGFIDRSIQFTKKLTQKDFD